MGGRSPVGSQPRPGHTHASESRDELCAAHCVCVDDVRTTIVDGEVLVDDFEPVRVDRAKVAADARAAARDLAARAGIRSHQTRGTSVV